MNSRGQAVIEALVTSFIWSLGLIFLLKAGLKVGTVALLDDWTDEHLLCKHEGCENIFASRLRRLGISKYQADSSRPGHLTFTVESKLHGEIKIRKEVIR